MALLAQNTFSIKRLLKEPLSLEFSSDTIAIPASSAGVADLTNAEFSVRVLKDSKELFPVFDESLGLRNIAKDSGLSIVNSNDYLLKSYELFKDLEEGNSYTFQLKAKTTGAQRVLLNMNGGATVLHFFPYNQNGVEHVKFISPAVSIWFPRHLNIYNYPSEGAETNPASVEWVAVYEGEVEPPSYWLPAPEELLSNATITPHNCTAVVIDNKIKLTTLTAGKNNGWVDVEVSYGEGYTAKRRFTWAKVKEGKEGKDGNDGADGNDGIDGKDGASYGNSNLINNGDFRYFSWWWDTIPAITTESNTKFITIGYSFNPSYPGTQLSKAAFRTYAGDYTLLAKVRNKNSSTRKLRIYHEGITSGSDTANIPGSSGWVYVSIKFKATASNGTLHFLMADNSDNTTIDIAELMLVRGSTVPDIYKPSDEDISHQSQYIVDAIKEGTSMDIEGGLVLGNIMGTKDATGDVKSYMSGLGSNPTAFAAGVRNFGSVEETKTIDLRHDGGGHLAGGNISWGNLGSLKIGVFEIGIDGKIRVLDIDDNSVVRFLISQNMLPPLSTLLDSAITGYELTLTNFSRTGQNMNPDWEGNINDEGYLIDEFLPGTLNVAEDDSLIYYQANVNIENYVSGALSGYPLLTYISVYLYKKTISGEFMVMYKLNEVSVYDNVAGSYIDFKMPNIDAGEYRIGIRYVIYPLGYITLTNMKFGYTHNNDIRRIEYGKNGMMLFYNEGGKMNYLHMTEEGGFAVGGKTDIPAGLGGASINSAGTVFAYWGKVTAANRVSKSGNNYTITHNIGDTDYSIILTPISTNVPYYSSKTNNTIVVTCAGGFDFILIRTK